MGKNIRSTKQQDLLVSGPEICTSRARDFGLGVAMHNLVSYRGLDAVRTVVKIYENCIMCGVLRMTPVHVDSLSFYSVELWRRARVSNTKYEGVRSTVIIVVTKEILIFTDHIGKQTTPCF
jgi:hypothetical protein